MSAKPKPTQEELDEQELREVESKIKELISLMREGHHREKADEGLAKARDNHENNKNDKTAAFHRHEGGKHITTTNHTKSVLELAEALKLRIQLGQYALELEDSLNRAAVKQVEILERQLKRARY